MEDPISVYRTEVAQRIQMLNTRGGWEGVHSDFKALLSSTPRSIAKCLKHLLAFANTPRRSDAYLIYGVQEDKEHGVFCHVGVPEDGFPSANRLEAFIHGYTKLQGVVVDAHFKLDGKRTPYIVIPLQYDGPYTLTRGFTGAPSIIRPDGVYLRFGSNTLPASERDVRRMQADWARWFLDCRYEKNATALRTALSRRFPKHTLLDDTNDHVRLMYDSDIADEFGTHTAPVLVHAYWGFDPVQPGAVHEIEEDRHPRVFHRTLIGPRFAPETLDAASKTFVRCIALDELYFVNDPYAQLCRQFLRKWTDERANKGIVIDLDYSVSLSASPKQVHTSILSFLEAQLQRTAPSAVLVHGAFGCGKTTTAKEFVAGLADDYLRGHPDAPKVLYVDVNNLDIKSRRDECIESQLRRYSLQQVEINALVRMVNDDQIALVFDGVDEMARPYTADGRREVLEILRDVGNRCTTYYLVRSSYYRHLAEMISAFGGLAEHDFSSGKRRIVATEVRRLRAEQVNDYLDSRLGTDDSHALRSALHVHRLTSFLTDPLIISLVAQVCESEGIGALTSFEESTNRRTLFLRALVTKLLEREQQKRFRHSAAQDFGAFQRVLRAVAFKMICSGTTELSAERFDAVVQAALGSSRQSSEAVDAFRTISWIHMLDDGSLSFRHEALTMVCAAEHVCDALARSDAIALVDWNATAPLANDVRLYAADILRTSEIVNAVSMLGGTLQFNVRQLITSVLEAAQPREDLLGGTELLSEPRLTAAFILGVSKVPLASRVAVKAVLAGLSDKRAIQVAVPMLRLLAKGDAVQCAEVAAIVVARIQHAQRNFCDLLKAVAGDPGQWVEKLVLKELELTQLELFDYLEYGPLFSALEAAGRTSVRISENGGNAQNIPLSHTYLDRTMRAMEGERQHRAAKMPQRGKRLRVGERT